MKYLIYLLKKKINRNEQIDIDPLLEKIYFNQISLVPFLSFYLDGSDIYIKVSINYNNKEINISNLFFEQDYIINSSQWFAFEKENQQCYTRFL